MNRLTRTVFIVCLSAAAIARADDEKALSELTKAGANVERDEAKPGKPIRRLSVNIRQITNESNQALKELEDLPALELIGAGGTQVPIATLRALQNKASLKRLEIAYAIVDDDSAKVLATLKSLSTLDLKVQVELSQRGLDEVFKLTNLKELTLSDRLVNDDAFQQLPKLQNLKTLNIRSVFVTDQGLASLRRLKGLQTVRISLAKDVTATGLGSLCELQLKRLEVTYYNVSDADLKGLRKATALTTLRLMNAKKVTEAAIPHLSEMKQLKELEIIGSSLTKDQIKKLKENLPDCKIVEASQ